MKVPISVVTIIALFWLTTMVVSAQQSHIEFTIGPLGSSGITGSGMIMPAAVDTESTMNAQWQGVAPGTTHMVSQYHGTSCTSYDAAPEFIFTTVTADSQGKVAGVFNVKKPFRNWPNRPHFLILHQTAEATSPAIACGMIVAQAPPTTATPAATATHAPAPMPPRTGSGQVADEWSVRPWTVVMVLGGVSLLMAVGYTRRGRNNS